MDMNVYTPAGKSSTVALSDLVFGQEWNSSLVHQVVVSMQSNRRQGSAHTKDRSEVSGGGKKPWNQKGTGRARHGSRRSPIWTGGGVTFGPRNDRNWDKKVNQKMRIKSLYVALSEKLRQGQVIGITKADLDKTKTAKEALVALEKAEGFETINTLTNASNICVVLPEHAPEAVRALRNMPHVDVTNALELNTLDVAQHRYIVLVEPDQVDAIVASRHHTNETVVSSATPTAEASA